MTEKNNSIYFDKQQLALVDEFRKRRNTSVLTVMFTDMKGYTTMTEEKGDEYSNRMIELHDALLEKIIEAEGAGKVLRHIGDAILAVFSEPSTAVERALQIQEEIRTFNRESPDAERLSVRIGLHMGQITVKDDINPDIFGRHVNRASRVEGLADGDQVFVTYNVLDSAKGWLVGKRQDKIAWTSHGRYRLKGITEPIEIFEVFHEGKVQPRAPRGVKKEQPRSPLMIPLVLMLAIGLIVLGVLYFKNSRALPKKPGVTAGGPSTPGVVPAPTVAPPQPAPVAPAIKTPEAAPKPVVYFERFNIQADVYLDHKERLIAEGKPGDALRKSITPIAAGKHHLHYNISDMVRYHADIEVKPGDNYVRPDFQYDSLPNLFQNATYEEGKENTYTFNQNKTYLTFDSRNRPIRNKVDMVLSIQLAKDPQNKQNLLAHYNWTIVNNGKEINRGTISDSLPYGEPRKEVRKIVFSDAYHFYFIKYHLAYWSTQVELGGSYSEFK
ncbi:MAG: adenylate/guanylate cyclase domain-containing protein [Desulfobacteraceae bacterium]|nr:MAG: adenylate/guanylate cyclase domain-containing protein [Desulfobacteraceae bacterium]